VNGVGTRQLAVLCRRAGIPFYVLCDSLKFDASLAPEDAALEDEGAAGMSLADGLPSGVAVRNPRFDVTPPDLITAVVTERGVR
jgi:translation initiation factor 2B subunit (eIF-2B alpha/beta/delta family)